MDKAKREALEAAGFSVGDYGDFLELTPEERKLVELRLRLSRIIRERRQAKNLTQVQAAALAKTTQSRFAKIESGDSGVTLDLMFRGLFAIGGEIDEVTAKRTRATKATGARRQKTHA